jgi:glucose/arabinose dehydrogenase
MLEEEAHRNMAFTFYHAYHMPNLSIADISEKKMSGGLKEVTVTIKNDRLMPTHASQDLKYNITRPDYISISGVNVVAGMQVIDADFNVTKEQKVNPAKMRVKNIPGNGVVKIRWIVKGNSNFTITVDSAKGGLLSKKNK